MKHIWSDISAAKEGNGSRTFYATWRRCGNCGAEQVRQSIWHGVGQKITSSWEPKAGRCSGFTQVAADNLRKDAARLRRIAMRRSDENGGDDLEQKAAELSRRAIEIEERIFAR